VSAARLPDDHVDSSVFDNGPEEHDRFMERTRTSAWAVVAAATGVIGGVVQIGKALPPIGATENVPPTVLALIVVTGLAAVAGGFVAMRSPITGGVILGGAGFAALIIDTVGNAPPPRILPALVVLIAAACALGAAPVASAPSTAGRVIVVIGVVLQVLIAYPMAALGLVAPGWAVLGLLAVWAGLLIIAIRQRHSRPWLSLAAPFATVAIAGVVLAAGGEFLGWAA
jgi:hypothetical protein